MMAKSIPAPLAAGVSDDDASDLLDETFRAHATAVRGWLIAITLATACVQPPSTFECNTTAQCGVQGTCEPCTDSSTGS